jgi:hypothetical protein
MAVLLTLHVILYACVCECRGSHFDLVIGGIRGAWRAALLLVMIGLQRAAWRVFNVDIA